MKYLVWDNVNYWLISDNKKYPVHYASLSYFLLHGDTTGRSTSDIIDWHPNLSTYIEQVRVVAEYDTYLKVIRSRDFINACKSV